MTLHNIRPALPSDAPHIATIKIESWREAYAHILHPETLARLDHSKESTKHLDRINAGEHILVATNHHDIPIAYSHWIGRDQNIHPHSVQSERGISPSQTLIQPDWPHHNILAALYVHPNNYRQGLGTALIAACAQLAIDQGHKGMMIGVFQANTRAKNLYLHLGATHFKSGMYEVDGIPYPDDLLQFNSLPIEHIEQCFS